MQYILRLRNPFRNEIRKVKNDVSDYVSAVSTEALCFRWISVQCYEISLPDGQVIIVDPFDWEEV